MISIKKNIPNALSILRIVMIIPFIYSLAYEQMSGMFLILVTIILTDFFDGYLARKWDAVSDVGKILDPLADKINIAAVGIVLIFLRGFPFLLAIAIILRDILIVVAGFYLIRANLPIPVSNFTGRISVAVFAACMIVFLFNLNILKVPFVILTVIMLVASLISYGRFFFEAIRSGKGDGASKE